MDTGLRAELLGRDRRRAQVGLVAALGLFAATFAIGADQVPTTPTGYDNAGNALHQPPPIVSPVWITGIALVAGVVAVAYAYWNGGSLVAVAIEAGALLPLAVFADYDVYRNGLSAFRWNLGQGAMTTLVRSVGIALAAGTLAYVVGNELRLHATGRREPLLGSPFVGDDPDLAGTQVAVGTAAGTLPLLAVLVVPYLPGRSKLDLLLAVVAVGLVPVAFAGLVARRRAAVGVPIALAVPVVILALHPYDPVWVLLLLFLVAVLATAEAAHRHGALVPCLVATAVPLGLLGVSLVTPRISGCEWMGQGSGPFYCSTGPVDLLTAGLTGAAFGLGIGLLGFLLGVGLRRTGSE